MLLLNLAVAVFGVLMVAFKPYACNVVQVTAVLSMGTLYLTSYLALSLLTSSIDPPPVYKEVAGGVGLAVNVAFVLWCIYQVVVHSAGIVASLWRSIVGSEYLRPRRATSGGLAVTGVA
jgi:predicted membrane channel-forming protein YqfA (hemolysin III family)